MDKLSAVTITSKDRLEDKENPYYLSAFIGNNIRTVTIRSKDSEDLTNFLFGTDKVDSEMKLFEEAAISDFLEQENQD